MQIHLYAVRVRFVCDAKGPLEAKPQRVVVTIARNHEEALQNARSLFWEMVSAGVTVECGDPRQLSDIIAVESLVFA